MKMVLFVVVLSVCILTWIVDFLLTKGKLPRLQAWMETRGVRNEDEMEQQISNRSEQVGYFILRIGVGADALYHLLVKDEFSASVYLLILVTAAERFASYILKHHSTAGDEEYKPYPLWKSVVKTLFSATALLVVLLAIIIGLTI